MLSTPPEVLQASALALAATENLADNPDSDLGQWVGHGPALSVYAMWAVYALEAHAVITHAEAVKRLKHLADLQRVIHYGRSAGWLAPTWWGSTIHIQHQQALASKDPVRYPPAAFTGATPRNASGCPDPQLHRRSMTTTPAQTAIRQAPARRAPRRLADLLRLRR